MPREKDPEIDAAIRRAGTSLLGEVGYQGFTIEQVARRAGVPKSTVYARWDSRSALLDGILTEMITGDQTTTPDLSDLIRADLALAARPEGRAVAQLLLAAQDGGGVAATAVIQAVADRRRAYAEALRDHRRPADGADDGARAQVADLVMTAIWGGAITGRPPQPGTLDGLTALLAPPPT